MAMHIPYVVRSLYSILLFAMLCGCSRDSQQQGASSSTTSGQPSQTAATDANSLRYHSQKLPQFVGRPKFQQIDEGLESASFQLTQDAVQVGKANRLIIVRPMGVQPAKSLPCYFLAAAGATPFTGRNLSDGDTPELTPWAKAGFVAVGYELDGELSSESEAAFLAAMADYEAAEAGLVNARNAIEYVLQQFPEVDPNRLYTGGHSSAGGQSLLLAAFDQRIQGVISYNGIADKQEDLQREAAGQLNQLPPELMNLLKKTDPRRYEQQIRCPVFLFHTEEDSTVSVTQAKDAYQRFKSRGVDVTLKIGHGDHYQPMIDQGIPAAIKWLTDIDARRN